MSEPTKLDATMVCFGSPPAGRTPAPGTRIRPQAVGHYQIVRELGRGGMGVVYEGYDARLRRPVAVKMMLRDAAAAEDRARFQTEAEAVAQLHHPNIVQIYEVGTDGDRPFVALEFLPGGSLHSRSQGKPQPPRTAAEIVRELASAMDHAHAAGVVHRDLKPANILFDQAGHPKVTDFGAARITYDNDWQGPGSSLTRVGEIIGTPQFMAPEQARGGADAAAPAVDVYALGAVLYSLLTGRPPFDAPDAFDVLTAVVHTDPVPPRHLQPSVPKDLETVCLKALEKSPARRYASAAAFAEDLGRFLNGETVKAKRASAGEKLWKRARRQPVEFGLTAALILVTVLGLGGVVVQWQEALVAKQVAERNAESALLAERDAGTAREEAERNQAASAAAKVAADGAREKAEKILSRSRVMTAALEMEKGDSNRAAYLLGEVRDSDRAWEWHHLKQTTERHLWGNGPEVVRHGGWVERLAISPDGSKLAAMASNPYAVPQTFNLQIYAAADGRLLAANDGAFTRNKVCDLQWDGPDRILAARDDGVAAVFDGTDGALVRSWDLPDGEHHFGVNPALIADGWAARTGPCGEVVTYDFRHNRAGPAFAAPSGRPLRPMGVHRRRGILLACELHEFGADACTFDLRTGALLVRAVGAGNDAALSLDGATFVVNRYLEGGRSELSCIDSVGGKRLWCQPTESRGRTRLSFSPDGIYAAQSNGVLNEVRLWNTKAGGLGTSLQFGVARITGGGHINQFAVSPDGRWTVAVGTDSTVRVLRNSDGLEVRKFLGHGPFVTSATFDPSGRYLFTGGSDSRVFAWDLAPERPGGLSFRPYPNQFHGEFFSALTFTPWGTLRLLHSSEGFTDVDPASGCTSARRRIPDGFRRPSKEIQDSQFDAAGRYVLVPNREKDPAANRLAVLDGDTGGIAAELDPAPGRCFVSALSRDAKWAASACHTRNPSTNEVTATICVWDVSTRAIVRTHHVGPGLVAALVFSPDAEAVAFSVKRVASANHTLCEWTPSRGTVREFRQSAESEYMTHLLYSTNSHRLAAIAPGGPVLLFDTESGSELWRTEVTGMMTGLAFSPDGKRLAGTGYRDVVYLWDTETGIPVYTLVGSNGRILDYAFPGRIAFSPCGKYLAANHWNIFCSIWAVPGRKNGGRPAAAATAAVGYRFHLEQFHEAAYFGNTFAGQFHAKILEELPPPSATMYGDFRVDQLLFAPKP